MQGLQERGFVALQHPVEEVQHRAELHAGHNLFLLEAALQATDATGFDRKALLYGSTEERLAVGHAGVADRHLRWLLASLRGEDAVQEALRGALDDGKRRPQLMDDVGEETAACLLVALQGFCHPVEGYSEFRRLRRGRHGNPLAEIPRGNAPGGVCQAAQRSGDSADEEGREDNGVRKVYKVLTESLRRELEDEKAEPLSETTGLLEELMRSGHGS